MGSEELLHGPSTTAAALAAGEGGRDGGLGKGIRAELGNSERFQMYSSSSQGA